MAREIERVDSGYPQRHERCQTSLVMAPIDLFGDEAQRARYLPGLARGDLVGCFRPDRPDHGSDPASMKTRARPVAGGHVLTGRKMWITNAHRRRLHRLGQAGGRRRGPGRHPRLHPGRGVQNLSAPAIHGK